LRAEVGAGCTGRSITGFGGLEAGFAPDAQLGYMVPFADGNWLAGLKFTYNS
jgi:hypothetical protein